MTGSDSNQWRLQGEFEGDASVRRHSRWRLAAWGACLLVLAAAAAGALGRGPLSDAFIDADGFAVRYQRVIRQQAETDIEVVARRAAIGADGRLRIWFSRGYLRGLRPLSATPAPAAVVSGDDRVVYEFAVTPGAESAVVVFRFKVSALGKTRLEIGAEGGGAIAATQVALP